VSGNSGFIVVNQQPVIQLSGKYDGLTVNERVKLVETRLQRIAATGGIKEELLRIEERNNKIGLTYRGEWLITADPESAYHQRMPQPDLAEQWRENLCTAFPDLSVHYAVVDSFTGTATWYGREFRGRQTASGERFDERYYTAAHRSLKFGTKVRVTNLANGLSVIVTINDRGPWVKGREIDLSWAAAQAIELRGVSQVKIEVLSEKDG
jgi:rare lipoprotein A